MRSARCNMTSIRCNVTSARTATHATACSMACSRTACTTSARARIETIILGDGRPGAASVGALPAAASARRRRRRPRSSRRTWSRCGAVRTPSPSGKGKRAPLLLSAANTQRSASRAQRRRESARQGPRGRVLTGVGGPESRGGRREGGTSPVPAQMWAAASAVPVQMWAGAAPRLSRSAVRCARCAPHGTGPSPRRGTRRGASGALSAAQRSVRRQRVVCGRGVCTRAACSGAEGTGGRLGGGWGEGLQQRVEDFLDVAHRQLHLQRATPCYKRVLFLGYLVVRVSTSPEGAACTRPESRMNLCTSCTVMSPSRRMKPSAISRSCCKPGPGADVAGVSPVPVQMWPG